MGEVESLVALEVGSVSVYLALMELGCSRNLPGRGFTLH
jgi:hypothetical protein